jgi:uncharacterized protein
MPRWPSRNSLRASVSLAPDGSGAGEGSRGAHGTILQVKVKPGSRISVLTPSEGGHWTAQIKSPPVDGKANAELVALVSKHFGCPRSSVRIKAGSTGRIKLIEVLQGN